MTALGARSAQEENLSVLNGGWPYYTREEIKLVTSTLKSGRVNYWTGSSCRQFEEDFSDYLGGGYSVALANGTLALELALRAFDFPPKSKIIVPVRSYVATALAVINVGCTPVFADVDKTSGNISKDGIKGAYDQGVVGVILVHVGGLPCELNEILKFCEMKNIRVIEDCAQAHGAQYEGRPVGTFGDIGCWSFCQDKIISTGGEGGMTYTLKKTLWNKMRAYKDHGKDLVLMERDRQPDVPGYRWIHNSPGSNFRMTSMQAEIGRYQLARLDKWIKCRAKVANQIARNFSNSEGVMFPFINADHRHAYYRLIFIVDHPRLKGKQRRVNFLRECRKRGVLISEGSCSELNEEKVFRAIHAHDQPIIFEGGRYFTETAFAVNLNHKMSAAQSTKVGEIIGQVLAEVIR